MKKFNLKFLPALILTAVFVLNAEGQNENSTECVRAKPESVLNRKLFPKAKFKLEKNKSFPFEFVGFETVRLKNGDDLTIKNYGCENYSLDFRFKTKRFKNNINRTKFWYQTAAQLMDSVLNGLAKDVYLPRAGTKALKAHIRKNKNLRFDDYIYFSDGEIKQGFNLAAVRKSQKGNYIVEISFGTGPL